MNIISWGGGTNSTALIVGLLERGKPIHLILFADTGSEKPETYRFKDVFETWLQERGLCIVTVTNGNRINRLGRRVPASLEEECLERQELPSKAYGLSGCSVKWKRQPMDRYIQSWPPAIELHEKGELICRMIGIDAGESHRGKGLTDTRKKPWFTYRFPLIEWGWDRDSCIEAIERAGLPLPGKSACFFCPATKKQEIKQLADEHPDLLDRALHLEGTGLIGSRSAKGLGRSWSWKDFLTSEGIFPEVDDMPCACFDGEE